jgi:mannosyl-3-phosphoglycerate phosphatase
VIFTDLDGTLLDHLTYSFEPALPALETLKEQSIPLVFCTSKTKAETEKIRSRMENIHPFIVENGGAIFIPEDYFSSDLDKSREFDRKDKKNSKYQIIELGTPYTRLREFLLQLQAQFPGKIKGFGDMSAEKVAELCEFSRDEALLAKQRAYDEPFILDDEKLTGDIQKNAQLSNLKVTRGGRFHHLMGLNDKGRATSLLLSIYKKYFADLKSVALGDSFNDLPMLAAVDTPILLPKPHGGYDPSVHIEGLIFAEDPGPKGWGYAILKILTTS